MHHEIAKKYCQVSNTVNFIIVQFQMFVKKYINNFIQ